MAENSQKAWDIEAPEGKLQVKARLVSDLANRSQRQLSPFRTWDEVDHVVIVLFDDEYRVRRAASIPCADVKRTARKSRHVNGDIVFATDELLELGVDWTGRLQEVGL